MDRIGHSLYDLLAVIEKNPRKLWYMRYTQGCSVLVYVMYTRGVSKRSRVILTDDTYTT